MVGDDFKYDEEDGSVEKMASLSRLIGHAERAMSEMTVGGVNA